MQGDGGPTLLAAFFGGVGGGVTRGTGWGLQGAVQAAEVIGSLDVVTFKKQVWRSNDLDWQRGRDRNRVDPVTGRSQEDWNSLDACCRMQ